MKVKMSITLFSLFLITGCVPSLHQLWTQKTLIYDAGICGSYKEGDNVWQFTGDPNDKSYEVVITEKEGKKSQLVAHLVKVDGQVFFDFYPSDDAEIECGDWLKFHLLAAHLFFKVDRTDEKFTMAAMDPDTIAKLLKDNPDLIKHEVVENDRIVLTDSPDNLQTFLIKGLNVEGFFGDPQELVPVTESQINTAP